MTKAPVGSQGLAEGAVMLPCTQDQFADFISGLLGKPQTLERVVRGSFNLERSDIDDLYHLVQQRILRQNDASLIGFSVRILYDDDSSVLTNSFEDFQSYNEIRPMNSIGVEISWRWIVKFRDRDVPEKQEIDVGFRTGEYTHDALIAGVDLSSVASQFSFMSSRIAHTDRSWGSDIDLLIKGFLDSRLQKESKFRSFLRRQSARISTAVSIVSGLVLIALAGGTFASIAGRKYDIAKSSWLVEGLSADKTIDAKISYLVEQTTRLSSPIGGLMIALTFSVCVAAAISIGIFMDEQLSHRKPSFVALTKQSLENRDAVIKIYDKRMSAVIFATFGTLVVAVIGRVVAALLIPYVVR